MRGLGGQRTRLTETYINVCNACTLYVGRLIPGASWTCTFCRADGQRCLFVYEEKKHRSAPVQKKMRSIARRSLLRARKRRICLLPRPGMFSSFRGGPLFVGSGPAFCFQRWDVEPTLVFKRRARPKGLVPSRISNCLSLVSQQVQKLPCITTSNSMGDLMGYPIVCAPGYPMGYPTRCPT